MKQAPWAGPAPGPKIRCVLQKMWKYYATYGNIYYTRRVEEHALRTVSSVAAAKKADMHTRSLATRSSLFLHAFTRVAVLLLGACRTLIRPRHRLKIEILDDLAQVQGVSCYEHESL